MDETWEEPWAVGGAVGGDDEAGGLLKPRKAKAASISYLQAVCASWEADADEARAQAHNVARELRWEAASVAADRAGGELLEAVARRCSRAWVERLARWCAPYCRFLAQHRHSSHVVQTLLALLVAKRDDADDADDSDNDDDAAGAEERDDAEDAAWAALAAARGGGRVAVLFCRALSPSLGAVLVDGCASHVLRAVVCGLARLPVLAERRGRRNERHAHSVDDAAHKPDAQLAADLAAEGPDAGGILGDALRQLVEALAAMDAAQLHAACVDASGAPCLALIVRVLAVVETAARGGALGAAGGPECATLSAAGPTAGSALVARLLELDVSGGGCVADEPARSRDIVFGLSSDRCGSVVIEAVLRHCADETHAYVVEALICDAAATRSLGAYVEGGTTNYVVQTILRTLRTKPAAAAVVRDLAAEAVLRRLARPDRLGVLSALCVAAEKFDVCQDVVVDGFAALRADGAETTLLRRLALLDPAAVVGRGAPRTKEHGVRAVAAAIGFRAECRARFVADVVSADAPTLLAVVQDTTVPWCRALLVALARHAPAALRGCLASQPLEACLPATFALFDAADARLKGEMAAELAPQLPMLEKKAGAFVARTKLRLFASNPNKWRADVAAAAPKGPARAPAAAAAKASKRPRIDGKDDEAKDQSAAPAAPAEEREAPPEEEQKKKKLKKKLPPN